MTNKNKIQESYDCIEHLIKEDKYKQYEEYLNHILS